LQFYLFFYNTLMNEIVVATCLPHKREGFLLSAFLKGTTNKLADFFFILFLYLLSVKQKNSEY